MDAQVDRNYNSYKSTLSSKQREVLEKVEDGTVSQVSQLLNRLSKRELQGKWLDYVLLTKALKRDHKSLVKFLLKFGCRAKIAERTTFHCTPLHYAFEKSDPQLASELMRNGASINATDVNEKSFLTYAFDNKQPEMIELILQNLKFINTHERLDPSVIDNINLFHFACYRNNPQAIRIFLDCNFSVNSRSNFDVEEWSGFTCLHFSISADDTYSVKSSIEMLLKKDVDFSAQDGKGHTPIHLAFRNKSSKLTYSSADAYLPKKWLKDLMKKGISNLEDQNGLSYFHIICCGLDESETPKFIKAAQRFLDDGIDINSSVSLEDENYPGFTALHFAVRNLQPDIVKLLLVNGADITKTNKEGSTPLHLVCDSSIKSSTRVKHIMDKLEENFRQSKIVELLLEYGADVDIADLQGMTPIHHVFYGKGKNESLVQLLISKSQLKENYTDLHGLSYLHIASSMDLSIVKTLIERGAAVNSCLKSDAQTVPGYSALHFAVSFNKADIVEYLLDHGANSSISIQDDVRSTALHVACIYTFNHLHNCKDWKIKVDLQKDLQSLHAAKVQIVESLLNHGASINEKDALGNTPLANAVLLKFALYTAFGETHSDVRVRQKIVQRAEIGQREMIELLLRKGADIHSRNNEGESILHTIASQGRGSQTFSVLLTMFEKGADINAVDKKGLTPLHVAIQNLPNEPSDLPLIHLFEKFGADINAISPKFGTPLHVAVDKSSYGTKSNVILDYILGHPNVDLHARKASQETPLHVAANKCIKSECYCSPLKKLLAAGADINIEDSVGLPPLHNICEQTAMIIEQGPNLDYEDFSSPSYEHFAEIFKITVTHFKKLMKAKVFISQKVVESFDALMDVCPKESGAIDDAVEMESNRLKEILINKDTSLHQIVTKHPNDVVNFVKNEEFGRIISAPDLRKNFPIFHDILSLQLRRGLVRKPIVEEATKAFTPISRTSWPDYCGEHILRYLSNDDLKNLTKAVSTTVPCKNFRQDSVSQNEPQTKRPRRG